MGQMPAAHAPEQVQEWIVLEVDNVLCGVAITQIQEINKQIEMTPVHQAPAYVRGVINLRGQIVTVIDLRVKFGLLPLELNENCAASPLDTHYSLPTLFSYRLFSGTAGPLQLLKTATWVARRRYS